MGEPQLETDVPLDAWMEVRVDGDTVTRVEVGEGESVEVHFERRE